MKGAGAVTVDGKLNSNSVIQLEFSIELFVADNICENKNIHVFIDVLKLRERTKTSTFALSISCDEEIINSDTFLQTYLAMAPEKLRKYNFPFRLGKPTKTKHNADWLSLNWRVLAILLGTTGLILFLVFLMQKCRREQRRRIERHIFTLELETTEIYE
ncbi:uncharacterized protein LOC134244509 [Saccostrea cucullata]|uniref:uncharacterized protein LOC134244509 n=1 Tax=Saccostrea cuccullata TaxID=36930 RepID=UPI002ED377D8